MRRVSIYMVLSILFFYVSGILFANELVQNKYIHLGQKDFPIPRGDLLFTDIFDLYLVRGDAITVTNIPAHIISKLHKYEAITFPEMEIRKSAASRIIYGLASITEPEKMKVQISHTVKYSKSRNEQKLPEWVGACNVDDKEISMDSVKNISYLELINRIATVLKLEIGVLDSGALIFGRKGAWLPSYTPVYILKPKPNK